MNRTIIVIIMVFALVMPSLLFAGDIFKCLDKNGNIRFSDKPCTPDEVSTIISQEKYQKVEEETESETETAEQESSDTLPEENQTDETVEHSEKISSESKETETSESETLKQEESQPPEKSEDAGTQTFTKTDDPESKKTDSSKAVPGKMSIQDFVDSLGEISPCIFLSVFLFPPVFAVFISRMHKRWQGNISPWQYIYSFFVYLVCIPGMFACVLTFYSMFFIRQNLLHVNVFIYFLPIISMAVTLALIGRNAVLSNLPGVDRLFALMTILFISFSAAFALQRTRIWLVFGGSFISLIIIALVCFIILKVSMHKLFRQK